MQEMPSLLDRRRLKDRIVESISKAVKQIQEYQFNSGVSDVVLTNHDWQFCRLVEHLDHAFLHGLRHITNGYWAVVQDFTHKAVTKEVRRMTNVTTNLGRGRAWLYLALMDHLLESYMRCFLANLSVVKRFYAKEALVLDQQRMHILLTLAAGLEYVTFQLDVDVPYLDLSSHMRPRMPSREESLDRISLCSMDSSLSQSSSHPEFPTTFKDNGESSTPDSEARCSLSGSAGETSGGHFTHQNGFLNEDEENSDTQKKPHMTSSVSMPAMPFRSEKSRIERVSNIPPSSSLDLEMSGVGLEVIHVKSKGQKSKKRKSHKKKKGEGDSDSDRLSVNSGVSLSGDVKLANDQLDGTDTASSSPLGDRVLSLSDELKDEKFEKKETEVSIDSLGSLLIKIENLVEDTRCIKSEQPLPLVDNRDINAESLEIGSTLHKEALVQDLTTTVYTVHLQRDLPKPKMLLDDTLYDCDKSSDSGFQDNRMDELKEQENGETSLASSPPSVYDGLHEELSKELTAAKEKSNVLESPAEESPKTSPVDGAVNHDDVVAQSEQKNESCHPAEVKVDNNLLLMMMLHIFRDDEEHLVKMYQTCVGHTEGDLRHIYLLVTSTSLYILSSSMEEVGFHKDAIINFTEIDYVLLGLNEQMVTIICTNRRKKFWITTGDAELTRSIVGYLDKAIRESERDLPRLSILTEPTTQSIALRKWLAQECNMPVGEVSVINYVLLHWEDIASGVNATAHTLGAQKEGMLLVRGQGSLLGTPSWRPNYFVLRDGALHQYSDSQDSATPKFCVQLNEEECGGCRRSPQSDRQHSFELILADGTILQLAAGNATESQDWLMRLCQAVAEGSQATNRTVGCLACCAVLTKEKIFLCHEDVQTNFFRTLGSADVTSVTSILCDPTINTYLVLTFNSNESLSSSGYWTLYFNAAPERDAFISSLGQAWGQHFQVSLLVAELEDTAILQRCREGQNQLSSVSV